ncbi:hypothetical protein [Calidifontibacter terrae]
MRTTTAAVLLSAAAISLAGCGTKGGDTAGSSSKVSTTTSASSTVSSTVTSTAPSTTTTTTEVSVTTPAPGASVSSSALSAELDAALADAKSFEVTTNLTDTTATLAFVTVSPQRTDYVMKDSESELRVVDNVVYLRDGARKWSRLKSSDDLQSMMAMGMGAMAEMASANTQSALIAKGRSTTFVGVENGERHYRTAVPGTAYNEVMAQRMGKLPGMSESDKADMTSQVSSDDAKYAKATLYVDTWIGANGLPSHFSLDGTELASLDTEADGPDVITLRYSKWNKVPPIVAPPAAQVTTMPNMSGDMSGDMPSDGASPSSAS